jgi:hypothetical protein
VDALSYLINVAALDGGLERSLHIIGIVDHDCRESSMVNPS